VAHIPDYMQVRQYLMGMVYARENIAQRLPTERELCEKLGVSRVSVRYAVRELIEHELIEVRSPKGMFINPKALWNPFGKRRKYYKIMMIWGNGQMLTIDGFYMGIMEKFCAVMKRKPVVLQSVSFVGWEEKLSEEIRMYNPDGIFWVRPSPLCYEIIRDAALPYPVCIFGDAPRTDFFSYGIDFYRAGAEAAKWMLARGCSHPLYAGAQHSGISSSDYVNGWMDTLSGAGCSDVDTFRIGDVENVQEHLRFLLDAGADGIFVHGANWFEVRDVLKERGGTRLPLLFEDNGMVGEFPDVVPDAKLEIYPGSFVEKAANALFEQVENPDKKIPSKVFQPFVAAMKEKRRT